MKWWLLFVCALALSACTKPQDGPALYRLGQRTDARVTTFKAAWRVDTLRTALADADGGVNCGRARTEWGGGSPVYADSARALLCHRLAFAEWQTGDTTRALLAYGALTNGYGHLLPVEQRAEALRSLAYVAGAARDTLRAMEVLNAAERLALSSQLNVIAAQIMECKAALTAPSVRALPCDAPEPKGRGVAGLIVALVLGALFASGYHASTGPHVRGRAAPAAKARGAWRAGADRARGRTGRWPRLGRSRRGRTR